MKYFIGETIEFEDVSGGLSYGIIIDTVGDDHYDIQRTDELMNATRYGIVHYVPERNIYPYQPPKEQDSVNDAWNRAMRGI